MSECPIAKDALVVLVGNGPSVLGAKMGKVIDAFDEVVRFNSYKTKGFEEYCGSKTTLYSCAPPRVPSDGARPQRILYSHSFVRSLIDYTPEQSWLIPPEFRAEFFKDWGYADTWRKKDVKPLPLPSSGCYVTAWLISRGVKRIHLIGFDHFAKHVDSRQHHYWVTKSYGTPAPHNYSTESDMFTKWCRDGRVFYIG